MSKTWKNRAQNPTCRKCESTLTNDNWTPGAQRKRDYLCCECNRLDKRRHATNNQATCMVIAARRRAKEAGIPFDITPEDVVIPTTCPILGIPLRRSSQSGGDDNSPSLDRIIPEKGYVRGNIVVMSKRANNAKNNLTGEELLKIAIAVLYGFDATRVDNPENQKAA